MDIKSFQRALQQIAEARGISPEVIVETIEAAIATAYKKDYGQKGQKIKAKFNPVSGDVKFWQLKLVVDSSMLYTEEEIEALKEQKLLPAEDFIVKEGEEAPKKVVFNPEKHIMIADAKKEQSDINLGDELESVFNSLFHAWQMKVGGQPMAEGPVTLGDLRKLSFYELTKVDGLDAKGSLGATIVFKLF